MSLYIRGKIDLPDCSPPEYVSDVLIFRNIAHTSTLIESENILYNQFYRFTKENPVNTQSFDYKFARKQVVNNYIEYHKKLWEELMR